MMAASAYGRLGGDPKSIETRTGTAMAVANLAVELPDRQNESHTVWLGVVAFGRVAETLTKHSKGDLLSVVGRVQFNSYTDRDGNEREQLQIVADSVISSRTVRPGNGNRKSAEPAREEQASPAIPSDLDDDLPF